MTAQGYVHIQLTDNNQKKGKQMKKRVIWALMVGAAMLAAACTKQPEENVWQKSMRQAAELGTVQYTVQKVVSNNDESWKIFGDRKILFSFKAVIKAGIDMEKFDARTVRIYENKKAGTKKICLELPRPEILSFSIRPDDVHQLYSEVSWLRTDYSNQERDEIVAKGEWELKKDKELEEMMMRDARLNAEAFVSILLHRNGFTDVEITFKGEDSDGME